ncbi:MAG: hydantoinase/oxoprolinase, partial [Candidatus Eremiobacteraeota bacterium]|nr:hydantoinase/oxoprolinase [Candidatus Eremiobacteraeota bacterium]
MLRTLDVRTLAIAGGSVARMAREVSGIAALRAVGPRSAHIAGLGYACFGPAADIASASVIFVRPAAADPDDYVALQCEGGARLALTPTCAANLLGYVPLGDFAQGNVDSARAAFAVAGAHFSCTPEALAMAILERATDTLRVAIDELIVDYDLVRADVELIGGGGGAAALVPFAAERLGFRHRLARDAEVISPLGVALALVRDVVERTIVAATPEDVVRVRREAFERVVAAGAAPDLVEVVVEIDARRNLVRATASGATAAVATQSTVVASEAERAAAAERALHALDIRNLGACGEFALFGRDRGDGLDACVVDARGVVRLTARRATIRSTDAARAEHELDRLLDDSTAFGDVGRALPEVHLIYAARVVDLGSPADAAQVIALANEELRGLGGATPVALVAAKRDA